MKVTGGQIMDHERSYYFRTAKSLQNILQCVGFFWYTSCIGSKTPSFEVIQGQCRSALGQSLDFKLTWPYFLCNTAVLSFHFLCSKPNFLTIIIWTLFDFWRLIKVIIGQFRVMRGNIIQNSKKFVSYDVLQWSAFFDIHHAYVPKC